MVKSETLILHYLYLKEYYVILEFNSGIGLVYDCTSVNFILINIFNFFSRDEDPVLAK